MNEDHFWEHPLGAWIRDCIAGPSSVIPEAEWRPLSRTKLQLKYPELCDGVAMSLVLKEIDPDAVSALIVKGASEIPTSTSKQKQFLLLLNSLRLFYKERLNQLIVMSSPDIVTILRNPTADGSGHEMNKFLLLLLGCAVQSERNSTYIERIQKLDQKIQQGLAKQISKLTKGSACVVSLRSLELSSDQQIISLLEKLMKERDSYATNLVEMAHEHESDEGSSTTGTNSLNGDLPVRKGQNYERRSPSPTMLDRHTNVEFATIKAENRRLKNEKEANEDEINLLNGELQIKDKEILRLQNEKLELVRHAREARDLKDELEYSNQKLASFDKMKSDMSHLEEKLTELEYLQNSNKQLLKERKVAEESNALLQKQIDGYQQKGRSASENEARLAEAQTTMKVLHEEISAKNKEIEQLLCEQTRVEKELAHTSQRASELEKELVGPDRTPRPLADSLFAQMEESERTEIMELRLENQKMRQKLEEIENERNESLSVTITEMEAKFEESQKLLADQKEENELINRQLNDLEVTLSQLNQQNKEVSDLCSSLREERDSAQLTLQDARRNFSMFKVEADRKTNEKENAKIRQLEAEVRELQRNLEKTSGDLQEGVTQFKKAKDEQKNLRELLDKMEDENKQMEVASAQADRARRHIESERSALKEKLEKLEDELENARVRLLSTDDARKRLENTEKLLVEVQNKMGDIQQENRSLHQQLELETKKVSSLREDLVSEKSRSADIISRLRSVCTGISLNGGKIDTEMDDAELIQCIDDVIMTALSAARREADALRIQQHTQIAELNDLKRDIEKLRRAENESLNESDDRVRELSSENTNIKEQVYLLQEKVRELQIEVATKNSEAVSAKRDAEELRSNSANINKLHNELATLQVSLRNVQLQEELLKQDNEELRIQIDLAEKATKETKRDADSIGSLHQSLLADHDRLQSLHDMLTHDYERAKFENGEMKKRMRNDKIAQSSASIAEIEELRSALRNERINHDRTLNQLADGQNEIGQLRRDMQTIRKENDCLARNCEDLNSEVYKLKLSDQAQKSTIKNLNITIDDLTRRLEAKEMELNKMRNRIEMLTQINRTREEERENLGRQIEMLMNQNKDLLNRALSDKDQYHQEQRDFQDKLVNLRRHKEKLEEKIMDQYKQMENKKTKDRGNTLTKRVAKALIPKRNAHSLDKNSGSTTEDSSVYSADESPSKHDDDLIPTCSSSEDADRISPRFEVPKPKSYDPFFARSRNDIIGGSVRAYPGVRRPIVHSQSHNIANLSMQTNTHSSEYDHISLHGSERGVDVPLPPRSSALPPRVPVRNSALTGSLRCRPPPPPYPAKPKTRPPPPYLQRTSTPNSSMIAEFDPKYSSTPIGSPSHVRDTSTVSAVVKEGEMREIIREKDERFEKALSIYENVNNATIVQQKTSILDDSTTSTTTRNESTVWYEYGCV